MLNSISCGDLELNISHPNGMPTLVASRSLERRLDWRLQAAPERAPTPQRISALPPFAVHLHIHYLETLPTLLEALEACSSGLQGMRLWISTSSSSKADSILEALKNSGITEQAETLAVHVCPNRGRNLGPLLHHLWPDLRNEALVLHLHGKRSLESNLGEAWLKQLLQQLLPDGPTVFALRERFNQDPQLGLVMPQAPELIRPYLNWGNNFELANQLAQQFGETLRRDAVLMFPAGSMFWMRPAAIAPLAQCVANLGELPPEPLPVDGSSLHAIERLVAHACEASGHDWQLFCDQATPEAATSRPQQAISVRAPCPQEFQQATALLAARCRQQEEAFTNLDRCTKQVQEADTQIRNLLNKVNRADEQLQEADEQLQEADEQLKDADATIRTLMKTVTQRDQQIGMMASSWGWKLTRLLKKLTRTGT